MVRIRKTKKKEKISSNIKIARVYEKPNKKNGVRVLVDRLWPRGLSKQKAKIDAWAKEAAPSAGLRKWFSHEPEKWEEFKKRYYEELNGSHAAGEIIKKSKNRKIILLFASKNDKFNNAVALKKYLEKHHGKNTK